MAFSPVQEKQPSNLEGSGGCWLKNNLNAHVHPSHLSLHSWEQRPGWRQEQKEYKESEAQLYIMPPHLAHMKVLQ